MLHLEYKDLKGMLVHKDPKAYKDQQVLREIRVKKETQVRLDLKVLLDQREIRVIQVLRDQQDKMGHKEQQDLLVQMVNQSLL
jgi:hypothetical protein